MPFQLGDGEGVLYTHNARVTIRPSDRIGRDDILLAKVDAWRQTAGSCKLEVVAIVVMVTRAA